MTKTIEERAEQAYQIKDSDYEECVGYYTYSDLYTDQANAYIKGATDQCKIDIEKMYHALENVLSKKLLEELRKAMEENTIEK